MPTYPIPDKHASIHELRRYAAHMREQEAHESLTNMIRRIAREEIQAHCAERHLPPPPPPDKSGVPFDI